MLALHGKKIGFENVLKMIDQMVATLKQEQVDDDNKKDYCLTATDQADDKRKGLEHRLSDLGLTISNANGAIATLKEEIQALEAGVKALDKSVAEASEGRKSEHAEFTELMASNSAAKEVLGFAKNRLAKFYTPKLFKADTGITVFAQVAAHVHRRDSPGPPPATYGAFTKKVGEHGGVVAMIQLLVTDLDKEMSEAEAQERDSQTDYEKLMLDSAGKRTEDSKALSGKKMAKADMESALEGHTDDQASTGRTHRATLSYINSLHAECDWLVQYHQMRMEARSSEIDALSSAKGVLNGADFSLLQASRHGFMVLAK